MIILCTVLSSLILTVSCRYSSWYSQYEVPGGHRAPGEPDFLNEWVVHVRAGALVAQLVALETGYVFGGEVLGFPNTFVFYRQDHSVERRTPSAHYTTNLGADERVHWAEQLTHKIRTKRYPIEEETVLSRVKRIDNFTANNRVKRETVSGTQNFMDFNDELWADEWYLQDPRPPRAPHHLNVVAAYRRGVTGAGVRVCVLDDGLEHNHTDLAGNYDEEISWDCNDRDPDPMPRYDDKKQNSHGTRCAGEIAMVANNKKCGVGVAWGAKIGGVRLLDGQITDRIEGEAIGYAWDKVDIYSASWGPDDNGRTVEGPGRLAAEALERGVTKGRGGKGVIYVWANGNGGANRDNCNCDGYASSIYTVSIASASQYGLFPWYGEICSSTLATAYSSGAYKEQKIATTDIGNTCTLRHTGTSAAAPLAAGVVALVLSANPDLTWRDVQHLIVWTSEYLLLSSNSGWQINGAGLWFDIRFGFGLLNAGSLVQSAMNWTNVPPKNICRVTPRFTDDTTISSDTPLRILFDVDENCPVNNVEHVELIVSIQYSRRGAIQVYLKSPHGTSVPLLTTRPKDTSSSGFTNWPLTSVATWGEHAKGIWTVDIFDETSENNVGKVVDVTLLIHGTTETPEHLRNGARKYDTDYSNSQFNNEYDDEYLMQQKATADTSKTPEQHESKETIYTDNVINDLENVLLRVHHGNFINNS